MGFEILAGVVVDQSIFDQMPPGENKTVQFLHEGWRRIETVQSKAVSGPRLGDLLILRRIMYPHQDERLRRFITSIP